MDRKLDSMLSFLKILLHDGIYIVAIHWRLSVVAQIFDYLFIFSPPDGIFIFRDRNNGRILGSKNRTDDEYE